jgi:hypothetical protein
MTLALDRIEIESAGSDPVALARALLAQLPDLDGRVPIDEIALALDIREIVIAPLTSIEACLQCDALKSHGQIIVNANSSAQRRRYSIGHELGHFLNERHRPANLEGFACTRRDMVAPRGAERHQRQEIEANAFAIEVLTPRHLLGQNLRPGADLEHALAIAERFDISRAAATRRYVALHEERLAAVFSHNGSILYIEKPKAFPSTTRWNRDLMGPHPAPPRDGSSLTGLEEVAAAGWLTDPDGHQLFVQTLYQQDGYAITLLVAERDGDDSETTWDPPRFRR